MPVTSVVITGNVLQGRLRNLNLRPNMEAGKKLEAITLCLHLDVEVFHGLPAYTNKSRAQKSNCRFIRSG
jgi:hypothetical protein